MPTPSGSTQHFITLIATCLLICSATLGAPQAWGQTVATSPPPNVASKANTPPGKASNTVPSAQAMGSSLEWKSLPALQQQALAPLAKSWNDLTDAQKRKWIALARNYPNQGAAEQAKMHERMAEWAALKPAERERARLNFAAVKQVPAEKRVASWETYQALPPEEKKSLADKASKKPMGAALAIKPTPSDKLAPVTVTRRTPEKKRAEVVAKAPIDKNTLLPRPIAPPSVEKPANDTPTPVSNAGTPPSEPPSTERSGDAGTSNP